MDHITDERLKEVQDRCRRIETRLTKFLESQGFDTQRKMPRLHGEEVHIPSTECSVADILSVLPPGKRGAYWVMHKNQQVCLISV